MDFLLLIIFVLAVAAIIYGLHAAAQRRKELSAWAARHGLSFDKARDHSFDSRFPEFKCLRRGRSRYAYNVMRGDWTGMPIIAFDYHYTTGSGKNRSDHHFSAVTIAGPVPLRPLFIRREGFLDKVTEFLGLDDIDFESAEFSRKFYVKSPDKRWAYDVIHQRMMEYLMAAPAFSIRFGRRHVIAWRSGNLEPAQFEAAAELISGMLDRLPEYLIRQQAEQAPQT